MTKNARVHNYGREADTDQRQSARNMTAWRQTVFAPMLVLILCLIRRAKKWRFPEYLAAVRECVLWTTLF